jgi:Family of unknown function (DUF6941)
MKVEIFTLCDAATTDSGGKINILGSFDHIWGNTTPITYPLCALALKIRFEKLEEGQKRIALSFIDADGKSVMPTLNAQIQVRVGPNEISATVPISLIVQQINLPHFGEYSIGLAVDGRQEASIPLFVRRIQSPNQGQIPQLPAQQ